MVPGPLSLLAYFATTVWTVHLVGNPLGIQRFRNYVRLHADPNAVLPVEKCSHTVASPSMLTWLILAIWVLVIACTQYMFPFVIAIYFLAQPVLALIYSFMSNVLFTSLTESLANECNELKECHVAKRFSRAKAILIKYKDLKDASKLILFNMTAGSTLMTIVYTYQIFISLAYTCLLPELGFTLFLLPTLCALVNALNFLMITRKANNCYESFQDVSECLRFVTIFFICIMGIYCALRSPPPPIAISPYHATHHLPLPGHMSDIIVASFLGLNMRLLKMNFAPATLCKYKRLKW